MKYQDLKLMLREKIMDQLDQQQDLTDDEISSIIDQVILEYSKTQYMSISTKLNLRYELFNAIRRLDVLQELLDDTTITEIMVNGAGHIFYEKNGQLFPWDKTFESSEKLEDVIQQIVSRSNRQVNESSPIVDTSMADGSRVNVVLSPVALDGPILTIRRFPEKPITMEDLMRWECISQEAVSLLEKLVKSGYNIFVSGGTGSGKTTMLNALTNYIPEDERVITIEDTPELQIKQIKNLVRLEVRNATIDGINEISIRDLIKTALRMRPSRIIIGEIRGPEVIDLLMALASGHEGSISTGHANSINDMISRMETMVMMGLDIPLRAIRKQIASSIDIFIQLGRLRDKSRRVLEISEVAGICDGEIILNPLFRFEEEQRQKSHHLIKETGSYQEVAKVHGRLKSTGNELIHREKLVAAAIEL